MAPTTQDTRDRILDVARELFTDQGYDATSLREIAEKLGVTKAALYYHFQSKQQIMRGLLEPFDVVLEELLSRLEAADGLDEWCEVLVWVIGQMEVNLPLFRLLQRNRSSLEQFGFYHEGDTQHAQMHRRLESAVREKGATFRDQVRMVAALAAVTGFDDWAPELLAEAPMPELTAELTATVRDILGVHPPEAKGAARRARVAATG